MGVARAWANVVAATPGCPRDRRVWLVRPRRGRRWERSRLVVLVRASAAPFEQRAVAFGGAGLPVPADVLVYTVAEWTTLAERSPCFFRTLATEAVWLNGAPRPCRGEAEHGQG
jgi:hypothetical protein